MIKVLTVNPSKARKSYFTDSVKVLLQVPADQTEDLRQKLSQINAMLDVQKVVKGSSKIYPFVVGLPIYARVVSIDSVSLKID